VEFGGNTAAVSVGNTFTARNPIRRGQRFHAMDDRVVTRHEATQLLRRAQLEKRVSVRLKAEDLPPTPPCRSGRAARRVFEVPVGARAAAIQKAIDQASALRGQRAIVHLPAGSYTLGQTLVIPAGSDVQLVGDGVETATRLGWGGAAGGPSAR